MLYRILIVNDDQTVLTVCKEILFPKGYSVDISASPCEGLHMLEQEDYDLLITGMYMPGMDGLELIEHAKIAVPDLNVIVITEHPSEKNMEEALKLGIADYIPRPFFRAPFLDSVEKAFRRTETKSTKSRTIRHHLIKGHPSTACLSGLEEAEGFDFCSSSLYRNRN
jgi:two-component system phosphoglycerate transport system response regulator PgtA